MATKETGEIFVCEMCGNEVIVTIVGGGTLVCCNKEMKLIEDEEIIESTEDEELEE